MSARDDAGCEEAQRLIAAARAHALTARAVVEGARATAGWVRGPGADEGIPLSVETPLTLAVLVAAGQIAAIAVTETSLAWGLISEVGFAVADIEGKRAAELRVLAKCVDCEIEKVDVAAHALVKRGHEARAIVGGQFALRSLVPVKAKQ